LYTDLFFDLKSRSRISANTWHCFRVVDTSLLPWDPKTEKTSDVNPQLLYENPYFQQKCISSFWSVGFEASKTSGAIGDATLASYCFEHDCIEINHQIKSQLVVQLAGYYLSHKDWVLIHSRLKDPLRDAKGSRIAATVFQGECHLRLLAVSAADIHEGSHKYGNGFLSNDLTTAGCTNPFCMIWESQANNLSREICHKHFEEHIAEELSCFCPARYTDPCITGRRHQTRSSLRTELLAHGETIRDERDDNGVLLKKTWQMPLSGLQH
jgi:hypothetical protein